MKTKHGLIKARGKFSFGVGDVELNDVELKIVSVEGSATLRGEDCRSSLEKVKLYVRKG